MKEGKDNYVDALDHHWNTGVVTTEPTEYIDGVKTFTCDVCKETKTEVIPALGHTHNYTAVVTAPPALRRVTQGNIMQYIV